MVVIASSQSHTLSRHERNEYGVGFEAVPHTLAGTAEGTQKVLSEEKVFRSFEKRWRTLLAGYNGIKPDFSGTCFYATLRLENMLGGKF